MRMIMVLYWKELKGLFSSWIAYVTLIAFSLLNGITFYFAVEAFEKLTRHSDTIEKGVERQSWNIIDQLLTPQYQSVFVLLFVMIPAITMRLFAEEKKQRTEELLLTSPIRVGEIVIAKYLAAITLISLMLLPVAIFPAILLQFGRPTPDVWTMLSGYLSLFLVGYALTAIGLFASSLTENQIVAFIMTVAMEMLFFIVAQATLSFDIVRVGDTIINLGLFFRSLSITEHFQPMLSGLFRLSDIIYFLSLSAFWLWATHQSVESTRWRG